MKSKIYIRAAHKIIFECPGCSDTAELKIDGRYEYGDDLVDKADSFTARHQECLDRLDLERAEAEARRSAVSAKAVV